MNDKMSDRRRKTLLKNRARELRLEADALEREARSIVIPVPKPKKTKAQLERELTEEQSLREQTEIENASLRRRIDPPDYSYFGLGDGPT